MNDNIVRNVVRANMQFLFLIHLRVAMLRMMLAYAHLEEARRLLGGEPE